MANPLIEALELKRRRAEELGSLLGEEERRAAERDWHAARRERPCGITVHTGVGCDFGCIYCYIWDMGFRPPARPYPLSGTQLAYALARNPHVAVGEWGTLVSVGSVTEPFLPKTAWRAVEYLEAIHGLLGNPLQISVKGVADGEVLRRVAAVRPSVLVTVTTLRRWRLLEPGAPDPLERLEMARRLAELGVEVTLFLRPIIPGITDAEALDILRLAREHGIRSVVPGTLRVTRNIAARLAAVGVGLDGRVGWLRGSRQVPIKGGDLKRRVSEAARGIGMLVLPASCAANVWAHGQACAACRMGPCGDAAKLPPVEDRHVVEFLEHVGLAGEASVDGRRVVVRPLRGRPAGHLVSLLKAVARREVLQRRN